MNAAVLACWRGRRIEQESAIRPNAPVKIGGPAILWHATNVYTAAGCEDSVICASHTPRKAQA